MQIILISKIIEITNPETLQKKKIEFETRLVLFPFIINISVYHDYPYNNQ